MPYKGTLVKDLQSLVEACWQRNSSHICAEGKQTEERSTRRPLHEQSLGHFEDAE